MLYFVQQTTLSTHTISIFDLNLHFGPNYTSAKFHVCIYNCCNAIVLTELYRMLVLEAVEQAWSIFWSDSLKGDLNLALVSLDLV